MALGILCAVIRACVTYSRFGEMPCESRTEELRRRPRADLIVADRGCFSRQSDPGLRKTAHL